MRIAGKILGLALLAGMPVASHAEDAVKPDSIDQQSQVNACDAFGPGYVNVAGTETCVKISGQFRFEQHFSGTSDESK